MMNETVSKSMIYGNMKKNTYGRFIPICAAISEESQVQHILQYIQQTSMFKQYNRKAYAYRVQESPEVFLTQKNNQRLKYSQGNHSDQTVQGSGQKLLHLLQKLNIKNIFIAVVIDQSNPLKRFDCSNYRIIVENSKELLNILYKKVQASQDTQIDYFKNSNMFGNIQELKKCNIGQQLLSIQRKEPKQRPNHIYSDTRPEFLHQNHSKPKATGSQMKFLKQRISNYFSQFQKLKVSMLDQDYDHLRYLVLFQKSNLVHQVFNMLSLIINVSHQNLQQNYDFKQIKKLELIKLDDKQLRKLNNYLISNKQLSVDNVMRINRPLGIIFSFIQLIIRKNKSEQRLRELQRDKQQQ